MCRVWEVFLCSLYVYFGWDARLAIIMNLMKFAAVGDRLFVLDAGIEQEKRESLNFVNVKLRHLPLSLEAMKKSNNIETRFYDNVASIE